MIINCHHAFSGSLDLLQGGQTNSFYNIILPDDWIPELSGTENLLHPSDSGVEIKRLGDWIYLFIRGMGPPYTGIFINGVPFYSASGLMVLRMIPSGEVYSVEILRGGDPSIFGYDNMAGVIHFKSGLPPQKALVDGGIAVGSDDSVNGYAIYGNRLSGIKYRSSFEVNYLNIGGYKVESDEHIRPSGELALDVGLTGNWESRGLVSYTLEDYLFMDNYDHNGWEGKIVHNHTSLKIHDKGFLTPELDMETRLSHDLEILRGETVSPWIFYGFGEMELSTSYMQHGHLSLTLGGDIEFWRNNDYRDPQTRNIKVGFVDRIYAGRGVFMASPGFLWFRNDRFGDFFLPRFGLGIRPYQKLVFKGNIARYINIPGIEALYHPPDARYEGNPRIGPEKGLGADVGLEYKARSLIIGLEYFRTRVNNAFSLEDSGNGIIRPVNGGPRTTEGTHSSLKTMPFPFLRYALSYTRNFKTYKGLYLDPFHDWMEYDVFKDVVSSSMEFILPWVRVRLSLDYRGRHKSNPVDKACKRSEWGAGIIVVSEIGRHLRLMGKIEDITDSRPCDIRDNPLYGRRFYLGVSASLQPSLSKGRVGMQTESY